MRAGVIVGIILIAAGIYVVAGQASYKTNRDVLKIGGLEASVKESRVVAAKFAPKDAAEAFKLMVIWGVRLLLTGSTRSGSVEEPVAATAHAIFLGDIASIAKLKTKTSAVVPNDQEFQQAVEVITISKASLARYYLRSLEMAAKKEVSPWFIPNDDKQTINLEHVLPIRPDQTWNARFPDEETKQAYVRKLGNLALMLAQNNAAPVSHNVPQPDGRSIVG